MPFPARERTTTCPTAEAGRIAVASVDLVTRDGRALLCGIDLDVAPGERLAIVGPNGAGKTSLLRLLFGRIRPSAGSVVIDGRDLTQILLSDRGRSIAVVGQSDLPDGRLTVADYVGLGRIPHRGRCADARHAVIVAQACTRVGLDGLGTRRLATLSGGERQRAAIARAIAQEPAILILDEPTNHLDPRARADILDLARGLGITVVAVLHDLALVTPFADRVAVLQAGRIVAHGDPESALSASTVRSVFAMDCFPFTNPATGRPLLVFDTPAA
ncbi:ABC transporter ATP-binding protein [Aureimonas sp. AU12]|uniref:ABC transporter ATP-binding protein n=1 Tax=Aureimonas sp. AU12 TaxID=1638161 RepID=UPI001FCD0417|nr:ABC transporter ATP-binding protein [Aureimonas sp. AU12]